MDRAILQDTRFRQLVISTAIGAPILYPLGLMAPFTDIDKVEGGVGAAIFYAIMIGITGLMIGGITALLGYVPFRALWSRIFGQLKARGQSDRYAGMITVVPMSLLAGLAGAGVFLTVIFVVRVFSPADNRPSLPSLWDFLYFSTHIAIPVLITAICAAWWIYGRTIHGEKRL